MSSKSIPPRIRSAVVALAAAAALVLTSCAPGAGEAPVKLENSGQELSTVKVGFSTSLANLYVGQEDGINNYWVAGNVQEGLVGFDASGKLVPALATEWSMPDPTTYVFNIRDDAKFHNGDPVTVDDIVCSFAQAKDPEASPGTSYYLSNFESFEKTGDHEITVKLGRADGSALAVMSSAGALFVTQQAFWEEHGGKVGTARSLLMGSGPYKVTEFQPDSHVTLDRAETWRGEAPAAQQIRIDFIADENARLLAAQKGDLDIAFSVPLKQLPQWEALSDGRVESVNDLSYVGLTFDQNVAPFDDVKVREAIALAVDQDAIVEKLLRGNAEVANTIMTPESIASAYDADEARKVLGEVPQRGFDLEKAAQLIAESSEPDGFTTEITYPNAGAELGTAAQSMAENLKTLGITLKVREISMEEWLATIGDGEHGLGFMWYFSTTGDPGEVNGYLLGNQDNPNNVDSPEAQSLIDAAAAAADPTERVGILMQLEQLNYENVYNSPLWWGQSITYFSNKVGVDEFTPFALLGPWGAALYAAA